jgi:hypothetical protein
MDDHSSPDLNDPLAALELPPGWVTWRGVAGLCYARLPRSSPPIVLRAASAEELAAKVAEAEQARRR